MHPGSDRLFNYKYENYGIMISKDLSYICIYCIRINKSENVKRNVWNDTNWEDDQLCTVY